MKKLKTLKLFTLASLAIAPSAFGAIIYQDDFESYSAGDNASTWSATGVWAGNTGSAAVNANTSIGGSNLANFTTGTGFNFLNTDAIGSSSNSIGTLSFDMYIPTGSTGRLRLAANGTGENRFFDIALSSFGGTEGIESTIAGNTVVHFDLVAEATATGVATLYANGASVSTSGVIGVGVINRFGMWTHGETTAGQTFLIDNVAVRNEVYVVPEPSNLALLGLLGLLGICGRRRRA